MKRNQTETDLLDYVAGVVGLMFKDRTILHCDSCDHETDYCLGDKCSWCGGKMIPMGEIPVDTYCKECDSDNVIRDGYDWVCLECGFHWECE